MAIYYAVCNANGPISRRIEADSVEDAVRQFEEANLHAWVDEPAVDAEDDLSLDGTGMTEDEFGSALENAGCVEVRDLDPILVGPDPRFADHLQGGWMLWAGPQD